MFLFFPLLVLGNIFFAFYYAPSALRFFQICWKRKFLQWSLPAFLLLLLIGSWTFSTSRDSSPSSPLKDFHSFCNLQPLSSRLSSSDLNCLTVYSDLFNKNFLHATRLSNPEIPFIIHFIWGGKAFPKKSIANIQSWMKFHPGWVIKFWTDDPDRPLPVEGMEKHLFEEVLSPSINRFFFESKNWGEKSDLLRYEILRREGGIYVDHDIECFRSFESFLHSVSFFTSMEPIHPSPIHDSSIIVTNCLIGSRPNHPILTATQQEIQNRWDRASTIFPDNDKLSALLRTLSRTFSTFDSTVFRLAPHNNGLIFPASWIFPDHYSPDFSVALGKTNLKFANHQWSNSWLEEIPGNATDNLPEILVNKINSTARMIRKWHFYFLCLFLSFFGIFACQMAFKKKC